jgi:putative ABC transport system permease protein
MQGGVSLGAGNTLDPEDVFAIENEIPGVVAVSPVLTSRGQAVFQGRNRNATLQGTNERYIRIRNWPIEKGSFFTESEVQTAARVIVLGKTVADDLFPDGQDPIGQTIRVRNLSFVVIGVLTPKGRTLGQNEDETAILPYTTVQRKFMDRTIASIGQIMVSLQSERAAALAETLIEDLLRQRHRLAEDERNDFLVQNMADLVSAGQSLTRIMTLLLGGIAGISLIVGGIGIMNIMLVSVTERTREIGIRMAVGARPNYIRLQFLTESVVLSLIGGGIGMVLGGAVAAAFAWYLEWPALVSGLAVAIAFSFSTAIGVFFGYYPAHKAAGLDPIEALRYE